MKYSALQIQQYETTSIILTSDSWYVASSIATFSETSCIGLWLKCDEPKMDIKKLKVIMHTINQINDSILVDCSFSQFENNDPEKVKMYMSLQ